MLRFRLLAVAPLLFVSTCALAQASAATSDEERVSLHESAEWINIATHLPDPETSSAADLMVAADVLRARRFPEDALDYYGYAIRRGAKLSEAMNKMGIVRLELGQYELAYELFKRAVREDKRSAVAWNNLGAAEFLTKHYSQALNDYRMAASLDKKSAIFHANIGLAYFELGRVEDMRYEFTAALRLDPAVFITREQGGASAHLLAATDYPRLCFEMARLYARSGNLPQMRLWLARSSESGYEVASSMAEDPTLSHFVKDPEVAIVLHNAAMLRKRNVAATHSVTPPKPLTSESVPTGSTPSAGALPANKLL